MVAGPDWDVVKRADGDWGTDRQVRWGTLAVVLALSSLELGLLYVGLGLPSAVSFSLTTAVGSVWLPAPAVIGYVLWLPLGLASASWRVVCRRLGRWGLARRLLVWASAMLAIASVAVLLVPARWQVHLVRPTIPGRRLGVR